MDETIREKLLSRFVAYLDSLDHDESGAARAAEEESEEADLFSVFVELAGLRNEVRTQSRIVKEALDRFRSVFDTLLAGQGSAFVSALAHLALPAAALGIAFSPAIMRVLRSSLLDVYQEDYIRQARLRGIGEWRILIIHALPNAILPTLTLMGVQFGFLFGGTLLVEVIYSYPGLGNLMVDAVRNADLPIIQTVGLTYCIMVLLIGMVVDTLVLILNPRLRGS